VGVEDDERQSSNSITFQIFAFCDTNFHHNAAQWLPLERHLKAANGRWVEVGLWWRHDKEQTGRKQHSKQLPLMSSLFFWPKRQRPNVVEFGNDNDVNFRRLLYPVAPRCRPLSKQLQNKGQGL